MTTSVLGLGAMGSDMALNLQHHGMLAAAWNRTRKRVEDWAAREQIPLVDEISHAIDQSNLIITCVSTDADLLELVERITPDLRVDQVLLKLTLTDYQALLAEGHGEEDISTLFHLKQRLYE